MAIYIPCPLLHCPLKPLFLPQYPLSCSSTIFAQCGIREENINSDDLEKFLVFGWSFFQLDTLFWHKWDGEEKQSYLNCTCHWQERLGNLSPHVDFTIWSKQTWKNMPLWYLQFSFMWWVQVQCKERQNMWKYSSFCFEAQIFSILKRKNNRRNNENKVLNIFHIYFSYFISTGKFHSTHMENYIARTTYNILGKI